MKQMPEWDKEALLRSPSFAPLHAAVARLAADRFPGLNDCNTLLDEQTPSITTLSGQRLSFVAQEYGKLPFEAQYEPRCYLKGEVATREHNWHDLLNALVWLVFPHAKSAINARHYLALTALEKAPEALRSQRGAIRDTNTLFDESGVIVACADDALADLLRNFQWKELFWGRRREVQGAMGFHLFGHGLYEKALHPYIGMTGQGLVLPVKPEFFGWGSERQLAHLDGLLAEYLSEPSHCLSTRELTPVPLLGVPGWTDANEDAAYYDNKDYFRSGRHRRAQRPPLNTAPSSVAG